MESATATPATAAGSATRPSCDDAARLIACFHGGGATKVQFSLFPGAEGGYNIIVFYPEDLASGQRGDQYRPRAQPRLRGALAENWRRRDPAAVPGPKTQPRRRKANVQSSVQSPPAAAAGPVALAPRQQEGGSNSERKRWSRSATRTARQHLIKMAEVAAKTQEAGAPEVPAPTAVGELGAGSHAPPPAPAPTATTPATPSCLLPPPGGGDAGREAGQEAKDVAALAAAARAAAVPATPPPRSLMVTACSPLSGKRGPGGPPSWVGPSAGSSGGGSSSSLQAAKKAWEITPSSSEQWHALTLTSSERYHAVFWEEEGNEGRNPWPIPNSHGPVIPRYSPSGRQLGVME